MDWENKYEPNEEHSEHCTISSTHFNKKSYLYPIAPHGPAIPGAIQMQLEFLQEAMLQIQQDNQNLRQLLASKQTIEEARKPMQ